MRFNSCNWELISQATQKEIEEQQTPEVIYKVVELMKNKMEWRGSATELLKELEEKEIAPTVITKILNEYHFTKLKENNIVYFLYRDKNGRKIILKRNVIDDNNDNNDSDIEIPILSSNKN